MVQREEVADTFWRSEFRVTGTLEFYSEGFVLEIHHGGKFVEVGNGQHKYVGGEVHWLERLDPEQTSCVELNIFAWRLGYRQPPVLYWFKHPYLPWYIPVKDDNDAMTMIETLPKNRTVVIYFVGGGMRRAEEAMAELELDNCGINTTHNVNVSVENRGTNNVQVQVQTTATPKSNEKAKRRSKQPANRAPRKGGKTSASVVSSQRSSNVTPAPISQPTHTFPVSYSQPTQLSILKRQNMPE